MKGTEKPKWIRSFANQIESLFQRIEYIEVTNTCFFIHKYDVPQGSKVTYNHILCDIRPQNTENHRVQLTLGGNKLS